MPHTLRTLRTTWRSSIITLLAGLLLPAVAQAEDPAAIDPSPAAAPYYASPESQAASLLTAGRCESALQTLLSADAIQRQPHFLIWYCRAYAQCGSLSDAVSACHAVLQLRDGFTAAEYEEARSLGTQALARYQLPTLPQPMPAPTLTVPAPTVTLPTPGPSATPQPWNGINRFSFQIRPFWSLLSIFGGAMVDLRYEHITRAGFLFGIELAPLSLQYPVPGLAARLRIGYGGPRFAISIDAGSGYPLPYPALGFSLRGGRLDRTYIEFSLHWIIPAPYPFDGLFRLSAPTSERWRFKLELGGSYFLYGPYLMMGGERKLATNALGLRGNSAINFGIGLVFPIAYAAGIPGPMLSIGYEKRF